MYVGAKRISPIRGDEFTDLFLLGEKNMSGDKLLLMNYLVNMCTFGVFEIDVLKYSSRPLHDFASVSRMTRLILTFKVS